MNSAVTMISNDSRQIGSSQRRARTISYFAAFIALGLTTGSMGPTLPNLAEQTHTHLAQISLLFTARSLGYLVGSLFGGRLYDRVQGNRLMAVALLIMALMMTLVPLVSLLSLLIVVLLVLGAGEGALDVGGNTLLVWVHGRKVGPFINGLHFFFGVGVFLSPLIIAQVFSFKLGVAVSYWALAFLLLPVAVWLLRLPCATFQRAAANDSAGQTNYLLVLLIAVFFFLYVGAEVGFGGWIFTYTVRLDLSNAQTAAYLTSAFWGALTLGRLAAIPFAARFRPRTILLCDLAGSLLSIGIILLSANSFIMVFIGAIGLGLSMASIFPTTLALAERRMAVTGKITGWFIVGASAGSMFLPWLIGQLFDPFGARAMMLTIMCALLSAVAVLVTLLRHSARTSPAT